MKYRTLKKFAKARQSYGSSKGAIALEMQECFSKPFVKNDLRFFTYHRHLQKILRRKGIDMPLFDLLDIK